MEKVVLKRSGKRPLEFQGELIATFETSPDRAFSNWSGTTGRWTEMKVYRSSGGRFVLWDARRTQWQGESDEYDALTFDSLEEVVDYLERVHPRAAAEISESLEVHEVA